MEKECSNTEFEALTEGKAVMKQTNDDKSFSAFYNPAQELNRDISVAGISAYFDFSKYKKKRQLESDYKFRLVDTMAATGIYSK